MIERSFSGRAPEIKLPAGAIDAQLHVYLSRLPALPGGSGLPKGQPGLSEYRQVLRWLAIVRFVITQGIAHQTNNANLLAALKETRGRHVGSPLTVRPLMQNLKCSRMEGSLGHVSWICQGERLGSVSSKRLTPMHLPRAGWLLFSSMAQTFRTMLVGSRNCDPNGCLTIMANF
ncbi:hypothetical protein RUM4293_01266 [Ruegeria atlantica]|uniref:Uncharacterized protein n=1 Tax=Ruegeria atlantica TaxID=81569 RepID=A0A0P1E2D4_9RHOB|nr:hypothetical protein RUM4293_01266 [Ruegeria atlantica]